MGVGRRRSAARRRGVIYRPLCFLLIAAAIIFGISVFFKTLHIEVEGAERYTAEEVISASGIETGTNLFLVKGAQAADAVYAALPYVEEVSVSRRLPNTIVLTVKESQAVAYLVSGSCWLLDSGCKVLEETTLDKAAGLIEVSGITAEELTVGSVMTAAEEDAAREEFLAAVLSGLVEREMNGAVTGIDASNISNFSFDYEGRFKIKLGQYEDIDTKFELLKGVIAQLNDTDTGTIDLSYSKEAHFIPD